MADPAASASPVIENLERLLAGGKDGAFLRFGLGNEYLKVGDTENAVMHLQRAVGIDPGYSGALKPPGARVTSRQCGRCKSSRGVLPRNLAESSIMLRRSNPHAVFATLAF